MKNKYLFAATPILLGILCIIIYGMIGSRVEPDGTLVEPFFLIPISFLFVFSGIISLLITGITSMLKRKKIS